MKKILTTVVALTLCITVVKAQLAKGNLFVGSSFGVASYTGINTNYNFSDGTTRLQNQDNYNVNIDPQYGVFLTDHLILGGMLILDYNNDKTVISNNEPTVSNSTSTVISTLFSAGPFVRYYFYDSTPSNTVLYLQADAALGTGGGSSSGSGSNTGSSYVSSGKLSQFFLYRGGFAVGVTHFVNQTLGLDFSVGYDYLHEHYTDNYNTATRIYSTGVVTDPFYSAGVRSISNGVTLNVVFHYFIRETPAVFFFSLQFFRRIFFNFCCFFLVSYVRFTEQKTLRNCIEN